MPFIGRQEELAFLEDCYASPRAQLVILYGRRRVGKTELLSEFCKGKQHVFSSSKEAPSPVQLQAFSQRMFEAGAPAGRYLDAYRSWEDALADIPTLPFAGKRLIVIDEFPYLARSNASLPSVIQNVWDTQLKNENVMIVLCGSAMSFIEKEVLSEKSPLYGRATGILKLAPLPYHDVAQFFPTYDPSDQVMAYAVLGGIPHYLLQFDPTFDVGTNIRRAILRRGSALYSETEFLMRQEFREAAVYNGIIQAIALGATQLNEIAQKTMVPAQKASVYLRNLMEVGIVLREFPVTAGLQERAKGQRGLYRIADNFFRFWYAFVFSNLSNLEASDVEGVWTHAVEPMLNTFVAAPFEDICRSWVLRENKAGRLPFYSANVGRWWDSRDEIDVLAVDGHGQHALAGECKFRTAPVDGHVLSALRRKGERLRVENMTYALFSKAGFTEALHTSVAHDENVRLVDVGELYR